MLGGSKVLRKAFGSNSLKFQGIGFDLIPVHFLNKIKWDPILLSIFNLGFNFGLWFHNFNFQVTFSFGSKT